MSLIAELTADARPSAARVLRSGLLRYRWNYLVGAAFLLATNLLALEIPRQLGGAINALRDAPRHSAGWTESVVFDAALAIVLLACAAALTRIASRIFIFNNGRRMEYDFRNAVFEHLTKMGPGYYQRVASGDLTSRVSNDASSMRLLFGMAILNFVNTAIAYVVALTKMFAISPMLALWCLAPFPFGVLAMRVLVRIMYVRSQAVQKQLALVTSEVQETIAGIGVVKAFSAEDEVCRRFSGENDRYRTEAMALATARGMMGPLMGLLGSLGSVIVLYLGGRLAIGGTLSLGEFVEFSAYVVILAWPTAAMGFVIGIWQRGRAALDRLLDVLSEPIDVESPAGGHEPALSEVNGALAFRDVGLELGGRRILDGVTFSVAPGERVALVGPTGSGKTTLLHLVPRMMDVDEGAVLLDGVDVREWDVVALRRSIALVSQDPFLFSETIANNVAFGADLADEEYFGEPVIHTGDGGHASLASSSRGRIGTALARAGLEGDMERFPHGLQTQVGERGITVSGGQKQRITIARALLIEPPILLLDDALSSVDTRTERDILDGVLDGTTRTLLMSTHRLAGLDAFDRIVVLDDGRVAQVGTHEELIAQEGPYAELHRQRALEEGLRQADDESVVD